MSLRGEGVGIFLCLNSLPNKCLPKFDRRFQLCRQPPLRGCCSAVQCSVRIVSQLRPALENFLVGYYAHQTQMWLIPSCQSCNEIHIFNLKWEKMENFFIKETWKTYYLSVCKKWHFFWSVRYFSQIMYDLLRGNSQQLALSVQMNNNVCKNKMKFFHK